MRHRIPTLPLLLLHLAACKGDGDKVQIDTGPWDDDGDGLFAREDCDDSLAEVGAAETYWADEDGDGHGDPAVSQTACNQPSGFTDNDDDCDDSTEFISPIARERCDNIDNDCDSEVDEGEAFDATTWYPDADDDGYGDESQPTPECDQPRGYIEDGTDCNDADDEIHPDTCELCGDDIDNDCDDLEVCESLGDADVVIRGIAAGDLAGTQARGAGDLDGDGADDLVVAAPGADAGAGAVYALLGPLTGEVELSEASAVFTLEAGAQTGVGLAALGDVDGDDFADVLVGAPGADAVVVWSGPDLSSTATFTAEEAGDEAGYSVSRVGDVDDDDIDDFLIGAPGSEGGSDEGGAVFLVYGPVTGGYDLFDSDAVWYGDAEGQRAGEALTGAGDMDGDGYEDFLFGADGLSSSSGQVGAVYVVYGPQVGLYGTEDVDVKWFGEALGEAAAYPAGVGDISGDGLDDVAIASPGAAVEDMPASGAIYLWFGARYTVIDNANHGDVTLVGQNDGDALFVPLGGSDGGFGDQNADDYEDLWIGALGEDTAGTDAGASYLVFGPVSGSVDLCKTDIHYFGEAAQDGSGVSNVGAGDINDDGVMDLLVGAPGNDERGADAGSAYVVFGGW